METTDRIAEFVRDVFKTWAEIYRENTLKRLKPKQRIFYDMLVKFHADHGRAPSYQEQADIMGFRSKGTTFYFCHVLIEKGWAWKDQDGMIVPLDVSAPDMY